MIIEKNNLQDFDTFNIYKWIFKTFVAVYILTNTFNIVMAVFDIGQSVVNQSSSLISGNLALGDGGMMDAIRANLETMGIGELIGLFFETQIVKLCMPDGLYLFLTRGHVGVSINPKNKFRAKYPVCIDICRRPLYTILRPALRWVLIWRRSSVG